MGGDRRERDGREIGQAQDMTSSSGVSVIRCGRPAGASSSIAGGAPALRDTALREPERMVERIHAIVLSGGWVYGLDATSGVQSVLRDEFARLPPVEGKIRVPIVVQASLFDLANGGDKTWTTSPYAALGREAALAASTTPVPPGPTGAGTGATPVSSTPLPLPTSYPV